MENYWKNKNIKIIFASFDCASVNGFNERLNKNLLQRIRCKLNCGDKRAWSKIAENGIRL